MSLNDPDMGIWGYTYDALGNLKTQTDARNCKTMLDYDPLNRLTAKSYDTGCPATTAVSCTYAQGTNQKYRRTGMTDGSGSAVWIYDLRGRMTQETKVLGTSSFRTSWTYDSADLVTSMTYPLDALGNPGEVVTTTYRPQMAVNGVSGQDAYVSGTSYDAAGRVTQRNLSGGVMQAVFGYYAWNTTPGDSQGSLATVQTGTTQYPTRLQNLVYHYTVIGNIANITDVQAGNQVQNFTYDTLDRLLSANAVGGVPYTPRLSARGASIPLSTAAGGGFRRRGG